VAGGHFSHEITARKILDAGYWWPALYKDVADYCRACDKCQRVGGMANTGLAQLLTSLPTELFMKWGLDFVGPIKPMAARTGNRYILVLSMPPSGWKLEFLEPTQLQLLLSFYMCKFLADMGVI
jgi:hypothetical protein